MDPQLSSQLVQLLAPYLPHLLKGVKLAGQERPENSAKRPVRVSGRSPARKVLRGLCRSAQNGMGDDKIEI